MAPDAHVTCLPRAISLAVALAALSFIPAAHAADGEWRSSFTIYGWLPGADIDIGIPVDNGGTAVSKSDSNILDNLRGAVMLSFDMHSGDWGFYADADWVKFSNEDGKFRSIGGANANASLNTRWDLKAGFVTLAGLYTLTQSQSGYTDFLFGGRYLWTKTNVKWDFTLNGSGGNLDIANSGKVSSNSHVSNAIIGLRGRWQGGRTGWYVPYYADIGTGDSDVTSVVQVGVGYAWDWGDIGLDWRWAHYDQGDNERLQTLDLSGPLLGLTWHF
jgi:hypothetical protein